VLAGWFPHVKPTPKSVGREGMVTVWACDGLYLGCMGVETWKRILEEEADRGNLGREATGAKPDAGAAGDKSSRSAVPAFSTGASHAASRRTVQQAEATTYALRLVKAERIRQDALKAEGRFEFTCADDGLTNAEKLACLTEEIGEIAQEVLTQEGRRLARDTVGTPEALRKEIVQVAAVALAWIEALS
jgi:NTP pyrophosphatase (non-canonical NTP hydrolase)